MTEKTKLPEDNAARQRAIKTIDRDVFLAAGAGSGKTRVLVDRYLWILEKNDTPALNRIITVTFTKRAAAEMKERVRRQARQKIAAASPASKQHDKWKAVIRQLETAPILTIHALCGRLLRENAIAARIDPSFAVLDDTDTELLRQQLVRRSILNRLTEGRESAIQLVAETSLSDTCTAIDQIISDRGRILPLLVDDDGPLSHEQITQQWRDNRDRLQRLLLDILCSGQLWRSTIDDTIDNFTATTSDDALEQVRAQRLGHATEAADTSLPVPQRLAALRQMTEGTVRSGAAENWTTDQQRESVADALRAMSRKNGKLRKQIERIIGLQDAEGLGDGSQLLPALAEEVSVAYEKYEAEKRDRAALDYEDLLIKVRDLWTEMPHVLARYQQRLNHVLIDEFQDTNQIQKDILLPLCEKKAKLFVVGDAKQSIYRFRHADVTVFNETRDEMAETPDSRVERLKVNFRSTPALVGFANHLFSYQQIMGTETHAPFECSYQPLAAHRSDDATAAAELNVVSPTPDEDDEQSRPDVTVEDMRQAEAAMIARRINEIVHGAGNDTAAPKPDIPKNVQFGDIAILFRASTNMPLYERALRIESIPYYSVQGRGFYSRQEVKDIINCLRVLENTGDELALVGLLRSPLFGLSDETLLWMANGDGTWWERLQTLKNQHPDGPLADNIDSDQLQHVQFAARALAQLRKRKNRVTPSRLIAEIIEITGISATLTTQYGYRQRVSNLRKLREMAADFQKTESFSLRGLIDRLQTLAVREERESEAPVYEEDSDVVRLLTIHSAKGLEWPVVWVPDLGRRLRTADRGPTATHPDIGIAIGTKDDGKRQWSDAAKAIRGLNEAEETAEHRRVLYVACTRAKDYLMLSAGIKKPGKPKDDTYLGWLASALDLQLKPGTDKTLSGDRWHCRVRTIPAAEIEMPRPQPVDKPTLHRQFGTDAIINGEIAAHADSNAVDNLSQQVDEVQKTTRRRKRFTVTEISTYTHCPLRYRLSTIDNVAPQLPHVPTADNSGLTPRQMGTVVHRILRGVGTGGIQRLRQLMAAGTGLPANIRHNTIENAQSIQQMIEHYLQTDLYQNLVRDASRLRTEMPVTFATDDAIIEGKIDALVEDNNGDVHIIDYKTGRRNKRKEQEYKLQIGLYCTGVQRAIDHDHQIASAAIVYLQQQSCQTSRLNVTEAADTAVTAARDTIRQIRDGQFPANIEDHCKHCNYKALCRNEGVRLPDDG